MACNSLTVTSSPINSAAKEVTGEYSSLRRTVSGQDLCGSARMRRSYSDNHLCYSVNRIRASSSTSGQKLKNSPSLGIFNFQVTSSILLSSLHSFLSNSENTKGSNSVANNEETDKIETEMENSQKRANWIERIMEIQTQWRGSQKKGHENEDQEGGEDENENEGVCIVEYDSDEEEEDMKVDREFFSSLLNHVSWSHTKLFSRLAFLSNMAYTISEHKVNDMKRYYGLSFITSSLEKKAASAAIKAKFDQDSIRVPVASSAFGDNKSLELKRPIHPSIAYEIAAAAACYIQSCAKDLLSVILDTSQRIDDTILYGKEDRPQEEERGGGGGGGGGSSPQAFDTEMCAHMAASTMTSVVSAGEKQRQEAARDLQALQSSPCDWFVCDDLSTYTRIFVIQGSDSLASWQTNLFFEPTQFEETGVLVHRGIYEAAKGIYEQFMPEIIGHLNRHGDRAKLQFTGHSLGGSLSLLVNIMLLTRKAVPSSALLPVVTFGSPFIFCGGRRILDELGLDESHIHCVMMHRDIVPRAFSCNYPNHVAQVLKRLNGTFRSHPCLNKNKVLYTPMGKIFILQPDEKSSTPHPLLPSGPGLYEFGGTSRPSKKKAALGVFLNSPHPLETLAAPTAYGSDGIIIRDHHSSNYLKAVNDIIEERTPNAVQRIRKNKNLLWQLLSSQSCHAWSHDQNLEDSELLRKEIMSGV